MLKNLRFFLLLFIVTLTFSVHGQQINVSGTVVDMEDQLPLPGVSVLIKGTTIGTVTDAEGKYSLVAPDNQSVIVFTFVGYVSQEIMVGTQNLINVVMTQDMRQLSEVVVTGFGTQLKQDLTGNIAAVKGKDIQNVAVPTFEQALQGRATGVFIESNNGKVGQGIKVRVRGSSSVTASNQPLFVIDGVPVTSQSQGRTTAGETNPMADINFNDVESIEILKDASAAAIFGSRASNGVVIITTKKGSSGKTRFNLDMYTGFSRPTGNREWMNAEQYVDYFLQAAANQDRIINLNRWTPFVESRFDRYSAGTDWRNGEVNEDWQDEAYQDASIHQIDLSASGGTDKTRFYASGSYSDQEGILIANRFERLSGRLNLDHSATDKLTFGLNMSVARTVNNRLSNDNSFATPLQAVAQPPIQPIIDPRTNELSGNFTLYFNGLLYKDNTTFETVVFRNLSNVFASYEFFPGLTFRSEFGVDLLTQNEDRWFGTKVVRNTGNANGLVWNRWRQIVNYNMNNFFTYNKTINESHTLEVVGGMNYQESSTTGSFVEGQEFPFDDFRRIASAADISDGSSTGTEWSILSYFARANYKFNNRYLLTLSGRVDGSSRFGEDNRYGFFPGVSAGWILSEENFLLGQNTVSFLKLRASFGLTGNTPLDDFASRGLFEGDGGYAGVPGTRYSQSPNPDLSWEQTSQWNIGVDFGFLNDRITGEIDYYIKKTTDLLLNVNVPGTTGLRRQLRNIGELENRGFELMINTQNIVGEFSWSTNFNIANNVNELTNIAGQVIEGGFINRAIEGESMGVFFAQEYAGVDPNNGDALYYLNTVNPDGSINRETTNNYGAAQRVVVGDPNPDFIGGLGNNLSYKGVDLFFLFNFVQGNDIYNGGGRFQSANGDWFDNQTVDQLNSWTPENRFTDVPEARFTGGNGTGHSSRWISDGSYIRLKTATLGYTLPIDLVERIKLSRVRFYVSGQNLLTFTDYDGWDPEVNADFLSGDNLADDSGNISQGNDFYSAPQARTITLGVNIGF